MALDWHLIESEADRESVLQKLSSSLDRSTPTKDDILRVEALLRDTSIPTDLRRNVSRALLKHTRRESTQRLPMLWTASSSDEEFRATDEIVIYDRTEETPTLQPVTQPNDDAPTAERDWDEMSLPLDATEGSGILSWSADELLKFVPEGPHTLRFHRRVYEAISRENTLSLLRRGMLLGMDVFNGNDWVRIVDHPEFSDLVSSFEEETLRVMSRCDIQPELETLEDLGATSDITRPLEPDPTFPFDDLDAIFDEEPQTIELGERQVDGDDDEEEEDDFTSKFESADRVSRRLPPGPLELASSHGVELDLQGDTMVARPSKLLSLPAAPVTRTVLDASIPVEEPVVIRPPAAQVNTARLSAIPTPSGMTPATEPLPKSSWPKRFASLIGGLALAGMAVAAYSTYSKPPAPEVTLIAPPPWRAIGEAARVVAKAGQVRINDDSFLLQAASDWADQENPVKAAELLEMAFSRSPDPSAALEIARMHAQSGNFREARKWIRDASNLGAADAEVISLLSESLREDRSLRAQSVPLTTEKHSLTWDSNRRRFKIHYDGELTGYFVPNWRGQKTWAPQVTESRICEVLDCVHRVPKAYPAFLNVGEIKLPRGLVRADGPIEGAFVEAPKVGLKRAPVELQSVWEGWLSASGSMPAGPYASRLLAWDRIDPNLRPDFANLAKPGINALEFSRQISSLFLVDSLLRSDARAERRPAAFGHGTGFDGTKLVSLKSSSMPSSLPRELRHRVAAIERIDKFEWLALQAMTPDSLFGVFDSLSPKERQIIWQERANLLDRYSSLIQEKGALNVLIPR